MKAPPAALARLLARYIADFDRRLEASGLPRERVRLTSWWRTRADNARVGGAASSQHLLALALDLVPLEARRARIAQALRTQGLVVVDEGDHLHVQLSRAGAWNTVIAGLAARGLL